MNHSIMEDIISQLEGLQEAEQREVLEFARSLVTKKSHGVPGKKLLSFAGTIESTDLDLMKSVIEEDCEQIDKNGW